MAWLGSMFLEVTLPFKTLDYFRQYFDAVQTISNPLGNWKQVKKLKTRLSLAHGFIWLMWAQYCWHYWIHLEPPWEVLQFNIIYICGLERICCLLLAHLILLASYYYHKLYFCCPTEIWKITQTVVIKQQKSQLRIYRYKGQLAIVYVRRFALVLVNSLQVFVIVIKCFTLVDIFLLANQVYCIRLIMDQLPVYLQRMFPDYSLIISLPVAYLTFELFFLSQAAAFYLFAHVMILIASFLVTFEQIILAKFEQNYQHLSRVSLAKMRQLMRCLMVNRATLLLLLRTNNFIGKLFVLFIVLSCPINCGFSMLILFGQATSMVKMALVFVVLYQWTILIGAHLYLARINAKLTRSNPYLLHLASQPSHRIMLVNKLRLSLYIQQFHVRKKKYGYTYWRFGLISMISFVKYILLYVELLMYSYKIMYLK